MTENNTAVVEKAVNRRGPAKTGNPQSDRKANAIKAAGRTETKLTQLTDFNVAALAAHADELNVKVTKTTATFAGTPAEALTRVEKVREQVKAEQGGRSSEATSLVAVIGKLRSQKDAPAEATEKAPAKKAPAEKAAKKTRTLKAVTPTIQAEVPTGYVPRYTHRSYDLYSTVPGEGKITWLVVCNAHGTHTAAAGGREGDVLGTTAGRQSWCKKCAADAKKAPAEKAAAK